MFPRTDSGASTTFRNVTRALLPLGVCTLVLGLTGHSALAQQESAPAADPGTRIVTNEDLPSLESMDASGPALPEALPTQAAGPRSEVVGTMTGEEAARRAEALAQARADAAELSVPELLVELERLQRREMRLQVPYLTRRFASATPEESEVEAGRGGLARYASVQQRLAEVRAQLSAAGVEPPASRFGTPAPLVEKDVTQSPTIVKDVTGGPSYPVELIPETDAPGQGADVLYRLEALAAPVPVRGLGDSRPEPVFTSTFSEELPRADF